MNTDLEFLFIQLEAHIATFAKAKDLNVFTRILYDAGVKRQIVRAARLGVSGEQFMHQFKEYVCTK